MTCSSEKPPLNRPGAAAATSPPSQPVSTALCRCSAVDTPPPPSVTAVHPPSPVTVSLCSELWPLTRPSDRSWCCRGSSGSCSSTTWDEALLRWERRSVSSSVYSPGKHTSLRTEQWKIFTQYRVFKVYNVIGLFWYGSLDFHWICVSRDHPEATQQMNDLIIAKVSAALKGHWANPDLVCRAPTVTCRHLNATGEDFSFCFLCLTG